jgi:rhodanese-related sulfurtransferase
MKSNFQPIYTIFLFFFAHILSAAELNNITPEQLKTMRDNNALVIDIRTTEEWNSTGIIPGSNKIEFFNDQGEFDANKWLIALNQLQSSTEQPVVLVCHSGNRSNMLGNYLANKLGMKNIYHLQNGIASWIETGNKIEKN